MPMKRKLPGRRRRAKRPRVGRKMRILRRIVPAKLAVKRTFYLENWTWNTTTTAGFWRYNSFTLSQLPNVVEFTGLFDEYKICAIKVQYRPSYDSVPSDAPALNVNTGPQSYAHMYVDPASTVLPSGLYNSGTLNSFLESDKVRSVNTNRVFSVYFRPKIRDGVQGTGPNAEIRRSKWIRTNETGAVHSGFHIFLQQNNFSTTNVRISLDVFVTFYMMFKNLR